MKETEYAAREGGRKPEKHVIKQEEAERQRVGSAVSKTEGNSSRKTARGQSHSQSQKYALLTETSQKVIYIPCFQ